MTDHPILFKPEMVCALLDGRKTQTRRILHPQPFIDSMGNFCKPRKQGGHWNFGQHTDGQPCVRNFIDELAIKRGDRLWVKETWRPHSLGETDWNVEISYAADDARIIVHDGEFGANDWQWPKAAEHGNVSPLFMPRWASRITLPVKHINVHRIQDISENDAAAEGAYHGKASGRFADNYVTMAIGGQWFFSARMWFADLWNRINAKPRPVKGSDVWVSHYVSYPWDGEQRTETYRGKPHHIYPNPWVAAYTFDVIKGNIDRIGGAL